MSEIITLEDLVNAPAPDYKRKIAVLRHADADGFGAAYAIWKALKDTCELLFLPVQYSQNPPHKELNEFGPEKIFIVDFSYNAETLILLQETYTQDVTVIDHHKTSLADLQKWQPEQSVNPGAGSYFHDETLAGCVLTWNLFHLDPDWNPEEHGSDELQPSAPPPVILLYVQDRINALRTSGKFELEHSKEINAYISIMDESFEAWDDFYTPEAYDCGKAILKYTAKYPQRGITLGRCTIAPDGAGSDKVWISIAGEESGQFPKSDLDAVVFEYFCESF